MLTRRVEYVIMMLSITSGGLQLKDMRFVVPVDGKMHEEVTALVDKKGLDSIAAYIRMLVRKDLEREKRINEIV